MGIFSSTWQSLVHIAKEIYYGISSRNILRKDVLPEDRNTRDDVTNALLTIDSPHYEVHEGEAFRAGYQASVSNNASVDVLILTGAKYCHMVLGASVAGAAQAYFYEHPTVTVVGTAMAEINFNRPKSPTHIATASITHTPTVSLLGTGLIPEGRYLPGGTGGQRPGTSLRASDEMILKPNEYYLYRLTNVSGQAAILNSYIEWYEETTV